jgi:hypothetical protein
MGANGTASCTQSVCGFSCNFGYEDCDKSAQNGCEANLSSDAANCGNCGNACPAISNGTAGCISGNCGIAMCSTGYGDCNSSLFDGCEAQTDADPNNCGACGNRCTFANATGSCVAGQCEIQACNPGYGDCDGNGANGCESNLKMDNNHCGSCTHLCNGLTPNCINGTCAAGCAPATGVLSLAGPYKYVGLCFYLSAAGKTCDAVCAELGGTNKASTAEPLITNDCNGGGTNQPATYFYQNGNKGTWTGPTGAATGYHTLGHGYSNSTYYGKCSGATTGTGTFPGDPSDRADRNIVCACF